MLPTPPRYRSCIALSLSCTCSSLAEVITHSTAPEFAYACTPAPQSSAVQQPSSPAVVAAPQVHAPHNPSSIFRNFFTIAHEHRASNPSDPFQWHLPLPGPPPPPSPPLLHFTLLPVAIAINTPLSTITINARNKLQCLYNASLYVLVQL